MKSIKCPHCGWKIIAVKPVHDRAKVIKKLIDFMVSPKSAVPIKILATKYARLAHVSYASGRRAIQRLAKDGYLVCYEPGYYYYPE